MPISFNWFKKETPVTEVQVEEAGAAIAEPSGAAPSAPAEQELEGLEEPLVSN